MDWRYLKFMHLDIYKLFIIIFLFTCYKDTTSSTANTAKPVITTTPSLVPKDNNVSSANASLNTTVQAVTTTKSPQTTPDTSYLDRCPEGVVCNDLGATCIECSLNHYCVYGEKGQGNCTVKPNVTCIGERSFTREYYCSYGYQLSKELYHCDTLPAATSCTVKQAPLDLYTAPCTVRDSVLCLGNRTFHKRFQCNWTSGYKWSTALVLSVTLGGFGVDRFYLGLWREGIGKLFSFGGLGVWTILDVILIAVGYVGPHDGSLYIYPWD